KTEKNVIINIEIRLLRKWGVFVKYVPLYIKTNNSLLSSMIKISDLIKKAKELNFKALTITDTNMYGVMEFYKNCLENNIKPIVGLEINLNKLPILLYSMNYTG